MGRSELQKLLDEKKKAKEKLFSKSWPKATTSTPLMVVFAHDDQESQKVLFQLLEGLFVLPMAVVVIANTQPPDQAKHLQGKITWVNAEKSEIDQWLLAADMALEFQDHQAYLQRFFRLGVVPIGLEQLPMLQNYQPIAEAGNSFTFSKYGPWEIFAATVRALETYHFPYDWQNIVRMMMKVR